MNRAQRRAHVRVWVVISVLMLAVFALALNAARDRVDAQPPAATEGR